MHRRKLGFLAGICIISLIVGTTYAVIMFSVDVPMGLEISGEWGMDFYIDATMTIPLTSIDFGTLHPGDSGSLGPYYIMNSGDYYIFLSYSLTDWPVGVTLEMELYDLMSVSILPLDEIYPVGIEPHTGGWTFTIHYTVTGAAASGVYSPTLTWNANDEYTP
ncbi:MAG: hypothetical protein ACFFCP_14515 [Promethearchaeota archaeon]